MSLRTKNDGRNAKPLLALTLGDTAGVGPELVIDALGNTELNSRARFLVLGDCALLTRRAKKLGKIIDVFPIKDIGELTNIEDTDGRTACLELDTPELKEDVIGETNAACGEASIVWVRRAIELALLEQVDGIVTAPINKVSIKKAGAQFPGHTELLGDMCGAKPLMMLAGGKLRVALVTRHVALEDVPKLITEEEIIFTTKTLFEALRQMLGIEAPKIGVLGLNPHASDEGRFGTEEKEIIAPAVNKLREMGIDAKGPLVPDVSFAPALKGEFDGVVAMYHDQGLIPLKMLYFDEGVNVTLGLPIVRTSPDHGTAFDIAGKGVVSCNSFNAAISTAADFVINKAIRSRTEKSVCDV